MTFDRISAPRATSFAELAQRAALPISIASIFLSALLLFIVEPMFAKMVLPTLGGAPAVWSVAMVFFQVMMLLGYLYAHALTRLVSLRTGALIHAAVLAAAFLTLPVALRAGTAGEGDPTLWLISVFAVSVGLPFFALSAQGPLIQAWFARSGHVRAADPYFLYAASNIGSFAALIAYPFAVEPLLGLAHQAGAWRVGFALMAMLVATAAAAACLGVSRAADTPAASPLVRIAPALLARWVALAFVPSGLMVAVTAHISTDIAATPLLWVIPLGLYLLSFTLAFRAKPVIGATALGGLVAVSGALALASTLVGLDHYIAFILVHLTFFFASALLCQTALYDLRPAGGELTMFYAALSLGGALGGLFAGLAAPLLFSSIVEYPILVAAALCCQPGALGFLQRGALRGHLPLAVMVLLVVAFEFVVFQKICNSDFARIVGGVSLFGLMALNWRRPQQTALLALAVVAHYAAYQTVAASAVSMRSFFGVSVISDTPEFRQLKHGTTLHGAERTHNPDGTPYTGRPRPTTYYDPEGPIGEAIAATRHGPRAISIIGLGAGSTACLTQRDEIVRFYEIDPLVIRIATNPNYFRFVTECAPQAEMILGDGRLTLAQNNSLSNLLVIDAFSSDAIPIHLLTREAFALYNAQLAPHGAIVIHTSNRAMDLSSVVARASTEVGFTAYVRRDVLLVDPIPMRASSTAVVLARDPADIAGLLAGGKWTKIEPNMTTRPWTDDYSTILTPIVAKLLQR